MTRAICYGGLVVGVLDLLDAFIFFGLGLLIHALGVGLPAAYFTSRILR